MIEHLNAPEFWRKIPEYTPPSVDFITMMNKDGKEERIHHAVFLPETKRAGKKHLRGDPVSWVTPDVEDAHPDRGTFEEYLRTMEISYPYYEKKYFENQARDQNQLLYELHQERLQHLYQVAAENYRRIQNEAHGEGGDVESREVLDRTFQAFFQEASNFEVLPTTWVDDNIFSIDVFLKIEDPDDPDGSLHFGIDTTLNKRDYDAKRAKLESSGPISYLPTHPEMGKVIRMVILEDREEYYANVYDQHREEPYIDRLREKARDELRKGKKVSDISGSEIEKRMSRLHISSVLSGGTVQVYERLIDIQRKMRSELARYSSISFIDTNDQRLIEKALASLDQEIELASEELEQEKKQHL